MFATKGIEYLLVIGYLALFVPFAVLLHRIARGREPLPQAEAAPPRRSSSWFRLPEGFLVHRGHAWALPEGEGVFRVGMDDFARRLIGEPTALVLPSPGKKLDQGERGWQARVNGHLLDLLSPVRGEVLEVNERAVESPAVVSDDPYGEGWLMKVRVPQPSAAEANLLSDRLARAWYDEVEEEVGSLMEGCSGAVLQDGGVPVSGFARELAGDHWPELAAKFLLTTYSTQR
jgi:glycine cleavage system H protein